MSAQAQSETMSTSSQSAAAGFMGMEVFQSIAMELMIFCATVAVAVVLKLSNSSGCAASFRQFWPGSPIGPPTKLKMSPRQPSDDSPSPKADQSVRPSSSKKPATRGAATQGPARILETIMDRAVNKNGQEALSLYTDMTSCGHRLPIQALLRQTRHSGLDFYSALVQSAVRANQPQMVDQLLDDMAGAQIERTLSFYESVMKVLAGKKHYYQAIAVYKRLTSEGFTASPVTLSCLINFTAELGDLDSAIGFFEQLASTSTPSIRAYMVALRVYSKRQDWTKSLEIFRSMQERNVSMDSLILNAVLATGVAAGKIEATEALLQEMAQTSPAIVDTISYNTVLKGYAHQKLADKPVQILEGMLNRGVKPNGITFNTVMDALVRGGKVEDAWQTLEQMQLAGIRPDKYTCTILMKGLHDDSTPKQLSKVIDMIQTALPQCESALRSSLFRGIIQAAARLNNKALLMRAFKQMLEQGVSPTSTDYQLMIQSLAQQGHAEDCSELWRHALTPASGEFRSSSAVPAVVLTVFATVMEELAKKDKVDAMLCAFESLRVTATSGDSCSSPKSLEHLLQQCGSALMQAASRRQHSSPALRRLLELAPTQGVCL